MKKVLTAIVVLGILALFAGSVFAGAVTMVVRANVPAVWQLNWVNTTCDFGNLPTNNLSNADYDDLAWRDGTPLRFDIRTNRDYQVKFGSNIDHLRTDFDNLGGGSAPTVDSRWVGNGHDRYNGPPSGSSTGNTNAIIQTQYQVGVSMTWFDNGKKDGPHTDLDHIAYTDAVDLKNRYVDDMGSGPNIWKPSKDWKTTGGTLYGHHWTGGATGTFWIYPRIRLLGLGQQPGYYVGDFTFEVSPSQWDGWS